LLASKEYFLLLNRLFGGDWKIFNGSCIAVDSGHGLLEGLEKGAKEKGELVMSATECAAGK
jgi:hypothetical protein